MCTVMPEEKTTLLSFLKSSQSTLCSIRNLFHIPNSVNCRCKLSKIDTDTLKNSTVTALLTTKGYNPSPSPGPDEEENRESNGRDHHH